MYILTAFAIENASAIGQRLSITDWAFAVFGSAAVILAAGSLSAALGLFVTIIKFL